MNTKNIILIVGIIIVVVVGYLIWANNSFKEMMFAPTPTPDGMGGWQTVTNSEYGFSMLYPESFFDAGHGPSVIIGNCNYQVAPSQCPDISKLIADSDLTTVQPSMTKINNVNYCKYSVGDAAAGHRYYYDYFSTVKNQKCVVVELVTSETNCDNYLPLESGNTEQATNYQNCVDKNAKRTSTLDKIISTFNFTK